MTEIEYFDALPRELRKVLRDAPFLISAHDVYLALQNGHSLEGIQKELENLINVENYEREQERIRMAGTLFTSSRHPKLHPKGNSS